MTDTFNVDTFTQTRDELQNLISGWCTKYARLIPSEILKKIKEEPIPEIVLSPNMTTTGGRFKRKSNQIIIAHGPSQIFYPLISTAIVINYKW